MSSGERVIVDGDIGGLVTANGCWLVADCPPLRHRPVLIQ
jgi:hypothetical protein